MQVSGIPSLSVAMNATLADCALLVALPLDRECFFHDLNCGSSANFAQTFRRSIDPRLNLSSGHIWSMYKPFADQAGSVISEARKLGVTIVERATLKDFLKVFSIFKATTLFAHSRPALFLPEDIVDRGRLLIELQRGESSFLKRLAEIRSMPVEQLVLSKAGADSDLLCQFLNDMIAPERKISVENKKPGQITKEQMDWHERRKVLEALLPGTFQEGAGVEFGDGWHSVDEIATGIPRQYSGALDLTICNSMVLAEKIRNKCPLAVPIANEKEASTHLRFAIYRQILRRLHRHPEPYEDAAFAVRQSLVSSPRQKSSQET
jgi:hypothetical protein